MAGSINKVILVGNLGADPVVSNTQSGAKVVNLRLATSDTWKDKATGERKEKTEWHRIVIFNSALADTPKDICAKVQRYILKVNYRLVPGKIIQVQTDTPPKSYCKIMPEL